jgi:hypothetical protein
MSLRLEEKEISWAGWRWMETKHERKLPKQLEGRNVLTPTQAIFLALSDLPEGER